MQITVSSEWQESSSGRRGYAVTLDEADLGAPAEGMSKSAVRKELTRRAEMMVIDYVARNGGMDVATAKHKLEELKKNG